MKVANPKLWIALLATVIGLIAAAATPLLFMQRFAQHADSQVLGNSTIALSILSFAGLVGLLAVLTLVAYTFAALDLADRTQALGLPEGSIRAVIALGLIVIFVISSLFLFGRLADGQTIVTSGLTAEQVAQISGTELISKVPEPDSNPPTFTVTRHLGPNRAAEDFSRQLLTTISTLVVAIASFYFGSKAVEMGQSAASEIAKQTPPPPAPPAAPAAIPEPPPTPPAEPSPTPPSATPDAQTPPTPPKPAPSDAGGQATAGNADVKRPAEPAPNERLADFLAKRVAPSAVPESSGALERGPDGKLRLKQGDAPAFLVGSPIGEIGSDDWLSSAKRIPIPGGHDITPLAVVIHYTEGFSAEGSYQDWQQNANREGSPTKGVLAHIVIDRDGTVFQCRPFTRSCGHAGDAGKSRWHDPKTARFYDGVNSVSIGIELANTGMNESYHRKLGTGKPYPNGKIVAAQHRNGSHGSKEAHEGKEWEVYPDEQLRAVFSLVSLLVAKYSLHDITGHDCVAPERKADPGPAFPMVALREVNGLDGPPKVWDKQGKEIPV